MTNTTIIRKLTTQKTRAIQEHVAVLIILVLAAGTLMGIGWACYALAANPWFTAAFGAAGISLAAYALTDGVFELDSIRYKYDERIERAHHI